MQVIDNGVTVLRILQTLKDIYNAMYCHYIFVILMYVHVVGVSAVAEWSVEGVTEDVPQGVQHGRDQPPCAGWHHTQSAHGGTARRG